MHAIVVGGGIGGLATARGLRLGGWDVTVLERQPRLEAAGAGLSLWPNALRALDWLGVGDRVRAAGAPITNGGLRTARGTWLARGAMSGPIVVHRADLHEILADGLHVRTGVNVTDVHALEADLIVGADGIGSVVRAAYAPDARIRNSGQVSWRAVTTTGPAVPYGSGDDDGNGGSDGGDGDGDHGDHGDGDHGDDGDGDHGDHGDGDHGDHGDGDHGDHGDGDHGDHGDGGDGGDGDHGDDHGDGDHGDDRDSGSDRGDGSSGGHRTSSSSNGGSSSDGGGGGGGGGVSGGGETIGPHGLRFGYLSMGSRGVYWYAVAPAPLRTTTKAEQLSELQRLFGDWHEPIPQLLAATDSRTLLHHPLLDLHPVAPMRFGERVALVGDAAHAMTPNLGQGACQALEDAVTLAALMPHATANTPAPPELGALVAGALAEYDRIRRPRVALVAWRSWQVGRLAGARGVVGGAVLRTLAWLTPAKLTVRGAERISAWEPPTRAADGR
ncbi:FAD-dependent monooxygenase [Dactylosporangium sp. NPDC000244]|uniref:FAD-dependent monooxygenase n=1 Tax=Dactylosporangium sp. NPDC000244 TaxID=3154365 RepID=UPI0033191BDD